MNKVKLFEISRGEGAELTLLLNKISYIIAFTDFNCRYLSSISSKTIKQKTQPKLPPSGSISKLTLKENHMGV